MSATIKCHKRLAGEEPVPGVQSLGAEETGEEGEEVLLGSSFAGFA